MRRIQASWFKLGLFGPRGPARFLSSTNYLSGHCTLNTFFLKSLLLMDYSTNFHPHHFPHEANLRNHTPTLPVRDVPPTIDPRCLNVPFLRAVNNAAAPYSPFLSHYTDSTYSPSSGSVATEKISAYSQDTSDAHDTDLAQSWNVVGDVQGSTVGQKFLPQL